MSRDKLLIIVWFVVGLVIGFSFGKPSYPDKRIDCVNRGGIYTAQWKSKEPSFYNWEKCTINQEIDL